MFTVLPSQTDFRLSKFKKIHFRLEIYLIFEEICIIYSVNMCKIDFLRRKIDFTHAYTADIANLFENLLNSEKEMHFFKFAETEEL